MTDASVLHRHVEGSTRAAHRRQRAQREAAMAAIEAAVVAGCRCCIERAVNDALVAGLNRDLVLDAMGQALNAARCGQPCTEPCAHLHE